MAEENTPAVANPIAQNAETEVNPVYQDKQPTAAETALKPELHQDAEFNKKFAALSRQEKAIRDREKQLEARMMEIEEKAKQYSSMEDIKKSLKYNPLKTLEEQGLSFEDLTKIAVNGGQLPPEMQMQVMREELEAKFQKRLEDLENRYTQDKESSEKAQNENAVAGFKEEIKESVYNAKDEDGNYVFEFIRTGDDSDMVYEVIEQHYNDTGEILDTLDAAEAVEAYLEEEAQKFLELRKIKSKLSIPKESDKETSVEQITLSNAQAAQASQPKRVRSREESLREAAKQLKWTE